MLQTFGDIPWFGFQFRNFVNEDRVFFVDEMILTVPLPPNTCNNQVDPSLCPCGPYSVLCGTAGADTIGGTNGCDCEEDVCEEMPGCLPIHSNVYVFDSFAVTPCRHLRLWWSRHYLRKWWR